MKRYIRNELNALRTHMAQNQLAPSAPIVPDDQPHIYIANINGQAYLAVYSAIPYPFDDDHNGPALICWYGLINGTEIYNYSSLANNNTI